MRARRRNVYDLGNDAVQQVAYVLNKFASVRHDQNLCESTSRNKDCFFGLQTFSHSRAIGSFAAIAIIADESMTIIWASRIRHKENPGCERRRCCRQGPSRVRACGFPRTLFVSLQRSQARVWMSADQFWAVRRRHRSVGAKFRSLYARSTVAQRVSRAASGSSLRLALQVLPILRVGFGHRQWICACPPPLAITTCSSMRHRGFSDKRPKRTLIYFKETWRYFNISTSNRATSCRSSMIPATACVTNCSPRSAVAALASPATPWPLRSLIFQPKACGP